MPSPDLHAFSLLPRHIVSTVRITLMRDPVLTTVNCGAWR